MGKRLPDKSFVNNTLITFSSLMCISFFLFGISSIELLLLQNYSLAFIIFRQRFDTNRFTVLRFFEIAFFKVSKKGFFVFNYNNNCSYAQALCNSAEYAYIVKVKPSLVLFGNQANNDLISSYNYRDRRAVPDPYISVPEAGGQRPCRQSPWPGFDL